MNMKKLIESMDHIEECGMVDEGPMGMAPPAMAPEMDKGNPVTVSVSMNASGKDHVADLLDMMKNAGLGDAGPAADKILAPRMDMERLAGIMDDPKIPGKDDVPGDADVDDSSCMDDIDADESVEEADYANEPDAQYGDMSDAIPDGNDLNRKKKAYAATQDGDNPMAVEAIKATLMAALAEKKAKPDFLDMDKDGDKKEPMKKAIADKKAKKGTDEGGQTKDCPKCGAPGKKKLMACSTCGCS